MKTAKPTKKSLKKRAISRDKKKEREKKKKREREKKEKGDEA
jgi:hypothetical protein